MDVLNFIDSMGPLPLWIHNGDRRERRSSYFTPLELKILIRAYAEYEHIFQGKSNKAAAAKERQLAWENIAARVNACNPTGTKRTWQQLKMKYKNVIQAANRKMKAEACKTGGPPVLTEAEELALSHKRPPVAESIPGESSSDPITPQDTSVCIKEDDDEKDDVFEYDHSELNTFETTMTNHHEWSSDTVIHHGNRRKRRSSYFTPLELKILIRAYGEYEHIFRKKSNKAAAARERQMAWENIAARLNACNPMGPKRTWQQLKMKYKNVIQTANRKMKAEACKTGGGPPALTEAEELVISQNTGRPAAEGIPGESSPEPVTPQDTLRVCITKDEDEEKEVSQYDHSELNTCETTMKNHHEWSSDTVNHHGNRRKRRSSYFTPLELKVLIRAYGKYEHIFRKKSNKAAASKERQLAWENIAARVNACNHMGIKRTWQQLKMKYKNTLQTANRKLKAEARKAGGGGGGGGGAPSLSEAEELLITQNKRPPAAEQGGAESSSETTTAQDTTQYIIVTDSVAEPPSTAELGTVDDDDADTDCSSSLLYDDDDDDDEVSLSAATERDSERPTESMTGHYQEGALETTTVPLDTLPVKTLYKMHLIKQMAKTDQEMVHLDRQIRKADLEIQLLERQLRE